MFNRVLIANRGEIALRIIRACKELGIESVVVFSKEDEKSLPVLLADEAICIGPREAAESYLNVPRIISAAEIAGADAIHPGYGFLAENEHFAEVCRSSGIEFIGPSHEVMRKLGNKLEARNILSQVGIPVLVGSTNMIHDAGQAAEVIADIGLPVVLKAAMGGGGRGIRIIREQDELKGAFSLAQQEAQSAFGNPDLYVEQYIPHARHVEIQVLADAEGHAVHFGERNCSVQRRYQKLIEEAPSPFVDQSKREEMGTAALKVVREVGYTGVGTVEFLMDADGNYYFIEMNTRLQVEHPVTEMITGRDLVKVQIIVGAGETLPYAQEDLTTQGVAIECRINAEDTTKNFAPSPGRIVGFHAPGGPGIRVDTHVFAGYSVSSAYDSLLAKLISWGVDREEALARMRRALEEFVIEGIHTSIPLQQRIIEHTAFVSGNFDTGLVDQLITAGE